MTHLSNITAVGFDKKTPIIGVSSDAKGLIEKFETKLKERALSDKFKTTYSSIDDILVKKYHLSGIDKLEFPDYRNKTEFISDGVRGNLQKIAGNILSYADGEAIINEAISEDIP